MVEIFTTATLKATFLKLSRAIDPAKVTNYSRNFFDQTNEPLISKASATRPTATTIAAVLKSTEYFLET